MSSCTIRPAEDEADGVLILELNARLTAVIDAPTHSEDDVVAFQDRFTNSARCADAEASATFVAIGRDGRRLGYVNVRESADEIADEKCRYIALPAVVAQAEGQGVGQSLLQEAEKWTREMGFGRLSLDVFASTFEDSFSMSKPGSGPKPSV